MIGNHDAHAKNFSLLYANPEHPGIPNLAPVYDLLSTAVYPSLSPKMAMKLGSKYRFSEVQARHWQQFAEACGLAWAPARKRLLRIAEVLPSAARTLQESPAFSGEPLVERILTLIRQRAAQTLSLIGGKTPRSM